MRGIYTNNERELKKRLLKGMAVVAMSLAMGLSGSTDIAQAATGTISGTTANTMSASKEKAKLTTNTTTSAINTNNGDAANSASVAAASKAAQNITNDSKAAAIVMTPKETSSAATAQNSSDMSYIKLTMENAIGKDNYSVYLEYPGITMQGNPITINNKQMRSASMIKVFIMSYAYEQIKSGKLSAEETLELKASDKVGGAGSIAGMPDGTNITITDLITKMITQSDNTATNMLIDRLGMLEINNYCKTNGFTSTLLRRKMMDQEAVKNGRENITTPNDLGKWFSKVYRHNLVGEPYDSAMITTLLLQEDTEGIPAAVGATDSVAHKTGELDNLCDDGGIVFSNNGDFILVVMDDGVARANALTKIHSLTTLAKAYTVIPDDASKLNNAATAAAVQTSTNKASAGPVTNAGAAAKSSNTAQQTASTVTPPPAGDGVAPAAAASVSAATTASTAAANTAATTANSTVVTNTAATPVTYTATPVAWNPNWRYADASAIHTDSTLLYKAKSNVRKNIIVALNAGHGTLNGAAEQTLCHPDGSPKVTGGSTVAGEIKSAAITAGTILKDGTPEAKANLKVAMGVKEALLQAGYDVLMLRENDNTRLDNIARTVMANNNADCHISIHFDSTDTNKGFFCINVPENNTYKAMEPVSIMWQDDNKLAANIAQGARESGLNMFASGLVGIDLTQTSFSTVPSVDVEVGDKASVVDYTLIKRVSNAIVKGVSYYFGK